MSDPARGLPEPRSIVETSLAFGFLADLVLKVIYFANELTGQGVVDHVKLPFARVVEELLAFLIRDDLLVITGSTGFGERAYKYPRRKRALPKPRKSLRVSVRRARAHIT